MTGQSAESRFTLRRIEKMLGLSRSAITALVEAGFVTPARGARKEMLFSFQDVVLLRTAYDLRAADVAPRRLLRALRQLKANLPADLPMSGLRIKAIGNEIAVREGDAHWGIESGQMLIDFEVTPAGDGNLAFLKRRVEGDRDPRRWFERGEALEDDDPEEAERAYRRAIELDERNTDAYLNLGAMLTETDRAGDAIELYQRAIERCPVEPLLHFNRAIAFEDAGRDSDALASYGRCLELSPSMADAHYNAARLHDRLGHAQQALRHYSAYRKLQSS